MVFRKKCEPEKKLKNSYNNLEEWLEMPKLHLSEGKGYIRMGRKSLMEVIPVPKIWTILILISIYCLEHEYVYAHWN